MPRSSLDAVVEAQLQDGGAGRYLSLRVDFERERTNELLWTAGGLWDRREKAYAGAAPLRRRLGVHEGQVEAARWFGRWMAARHAGELVYEHGRPVFTVLLVGGRRAGKSNMAFRFGLAYAADFPGAVVWPVVPTFGDVPEFELELEGQMPASWYTYYGDPLFTYYLANASQIVIRSGHNPRALKRGRVDVAIVNEAQDQDRKVYDTVRPAVADRGGLVVLVANPPEDARGQWVADLLERAELRKAGVKVFRLDNRDNPHVVGAAIESLKDDLDERTFRIQGRGEFLPRLDRVFYGFSAYENVEVVPAHAGVTAPFLHRKLGIDAASCVHGMDFQKDPWMVASSIRFYEDPTDPGGDPLVWIFDEALIEQGLEEDLVNALEAHGHTGADPVIADASGDYQGGDRTVKSRASFDVIRRRGWRRLYKPDARSDRNPPVMERFAVGNSLIRSAAGKRKLRVDPRCVHTIASLKNYENYRGVPSRRSQWAHAADSWTYPCYRLFPRRAPSSTIHATLLKRPPRGGWEDIK